MNNQVLIVILVFLALILCLLIGFILIFSPQILSALTIRKIREKDPKNKKGYVYKMRILGNYHLDKLLMQGVKSDEELSKFIEKEITKNLFKVKLKSPEVSCSAFSAIDKETNHKIFGRNYDLEETSSMIVYTKKSKYRHASISSVDLKFIGLKNSEIKGILKKCLSFAGILVPLDGINDAGVSCGIFMSYQGKDGQVIPTNQNVKGKIDVTSTIMLRTILDKASSTKDAIKILQNINLHDSGKTSFHYMISDKNGDSAIVEFVNESFNNDLDGSKRKIKIYTSENKSELGDLESKHDFMCISNFNLTKNYYQNEKGKIDVTSTIMLRTILDKASSTKEAIKILQNINLHDSGKTSFHYMISDKNGDSAIVEFVNDSFNNDLDGSKRKIKIYTNENKSELGDLESSHDFMCISNFILTKNYYQNEKEKKGLDRYLFMYQYLSEHNEGKISKQEAIELLKILGRRDWNKKHNQNVNRITPWSVLYDLSEKSMIWVPNEEFDKPENFIKMKL